MNRAHLERLVLSSLFLGLGVVLPMLFGQVQAIGEVLLPMHIPIFLCGIICGWKYGLAIGVILPFLRTFLFGVPPLYPNAIAIAFELATYGLVIGMLYHRRKNPTTKYLMFCLVVSMIVGRIVWGIAQASLLGFVGKSLAMKTFITVGVLNETPGIVIHLILIPLVIGLLNHAKINRLSHTSDAQSTKDESNTEEL